MTLEVFFAPEARADLLQIYDYAASGGELRALAYVERITARCRRLADFPERGTRRDDLFPGLRTMGFERRGTIAFTLDGKTVMILRVLHGGRDLAAAFGD